MRKLPTKEVEYEEAPSGYVKLYNYKEPFMKFNGGHGYQGVLLVDTAIILEVGRKQSRKLLVQ